MPRPRGRSPIAARVSSSTPVVRNRSSALPGRVDHPERRVPRPGQLRRRLDDALQERVERELRAERDARVDEHAKPVELAGGRVHARILTSEDGRVSAHLPGAASIDLYWLPLGAGGHFVRLNGRMYEALAALRERRTRCALYHSALEVHVPDGSRFVVEQAPAWRQSGERGVVAEGAVGSRAAGRFRLFRYEVRRWRDGVIPDLAEAVESPRRLSDDARLRSPRCSSSCRRCRRSSGVATSWAPARCGTRTR